MTNKSNTSDKCRTIYIALLPIYNIVEAYKSLENLCAPFSDVPPNKSNSKDVKQIVGSLYNTFNEIIRQACHISDERLHDEDEKGRTFFSHTEKAFTKLISFKKMPEIMDLQNICIDLINDLKAADVITKSMCVKTCYWPYYKMSTLPDN